MCTEDTGNSAQTDSSGCLRSSAKGDLPYRGPQNSGHVRSGYSADHPHIPLPLGVSAGDSQLSWDLLWELPLPKEPETHWHGVQSSTTFLEVWQFRRAPAADRAALGLSPAPPSASAPWSCPRSPTPSPCRQASQSQGLCPGNQPVTTSTSSLHPHPLSNH